ncbi:hypothetical protein LINPERPRIM_LOCUS2556 [Linum perenne]
MLLFSTG